MTTPNVSAADAELMRLETASRVIAANLVDLDNNPTRKDLDTGPLAGRTAAAWADAAEALTQLWDGYRMLGDLIGQARALRDQRKFTDVDKAAYAQMILGPSVVLSTRTVPLAQRGLLGAGQVDTTCTPAQLLSAMEAAFTAAVTVTTAVADVWQRLLPAAASVAASLDNVRTLTREAGGSTATLDDADRQLGGFTSTLASDPLAAQDSDLAAIQTLVDRADAERTSAVQLRGALTQRLADARTQLATLATAQQQARQAHDATAGRFTAPGESDSASDAADPAADLDDLRADLTGIEALAAAGQWSLISPRLADWTRTVRARIDRLQAAGAYDADLIAQRNELRGRLDAYQAKALRRGFAEDSDLSALADAAREVLFTAPCDLDAARTAVNAYQNALASLIEREGRP